MKRLFFVVLMVLSFDIFAGADLKGKIARTWLDQSGNLWMKMDSAAFDNYCKPGWYNFNLYIPSTDKSFPYYYGMITSAQAKQQYVYLANMSTFDGSKACDLTKTGYGIVVLSN